MKLVDLKHELHLFLFFLFLFFLLLFSSISNQLKAHDNNSEFVHSGEQKVSGCCPAAIVYKHTDETTAVLLVLLVPP